jgi:hypothetical protein
LLKSNARVLWSLTISTLVGVTTGLAVAQNAPGHTSKKNDPVHLMVVMFDSPRVLHQAPVPESTCLFSLRRFEQEGPYELTVHAIAKGGSLQAVTGRVIQLHCITPEGRVLGEQVGQPITERPSNFVPLKLPRGVEVEIPKGWWLLGNDLLRLVATSVEAAMDLSDLALPSGEKKINLVAANSMPPSTYAAIRIDSITSPSMTRAEYDAITAAELAELQQKMKETLLKLLPMQGNTLLGDLVIRLEQFSGHPAVTFEYRRTGPQGPVWVQLNQVFTGYQEVTINLSYREAEAALWRPVVAKIRNSIAIAPIPTVPRAEKIAVPAGTDYLLCGKPEQPDAPTYSLEIVKDAVGSPTELRVAGSFNMRQYKVTKATGIAIAAEELGPSAPDAVGRLFLDRVTGRLMTQNFISFAAVDVLVRLCGGQLDREACRNEMMRTKGGNPFACGDTGRCDRWRSRSNLLVVHTDTCSHAKRKF